MRRCAFALSLLVVSIGAAGQGPTVFINGDTGVSASGSGFALGKVGVGGGTVAKHDKTAEMARVLLKSCPEVSVTVSETDSHPDYLLLLSREEGAFGGGLSQIMVLRPDKAVVFASKQTTAARATKASCKAILADWRDRRPHVARESAPPPGWKASQ